MYLLTHHGKPISKPHPHRITCYIEAIERGLVAKSGRMYWLMNVQIEKCDDETRVAATCRAIVTGTVRQQTLAGAHDRRRASGLE